MAQRDPCGYARIRASWLRQDMPAPAGMWPLCAETRNLSLGGGHVG